MELVTVFKSFSPAEAELVRSRLEANNFFVFVKNEIAALGTDGYTMAAGGIWVQVPEDQAADARTLIESKDSACEE